MFDKFRGLQLAGPARDCLEACQVERMGGVGTDSAIDQCWLRCEGIDTSVDANATRKSRRRSASERAGRVRVLLFVAANTEGRKRYVRKHEVRREEMWVCQDAGREREKKEKE